MIPVVCFRLTEIRIIHRQAIAILLAVPAFEYKVLIGVDPTTTVGGIKFEDGTPEQSSGDVDIFQFTQPTQKNTGTTLTAVGFKNSTAHIVQILGPICDSNAVEITSFKAQSASFFSVLLQWLGLR